MVIGDKFPDLLGIDADGKEVRLSEFPDKRFIIYFYPKDNTPGCTLEAQSLRDNYDTLLGMGYQVIGVSKDSEASHKRFAEKQCLPFPLVADKSLELCNLAGVMVDGKLKRTTFVCDHNGTVTDKIEKVQTRTAAEQLFALLDGRNSINPA